jgi:hypothetical protein
MVQTVSQNSEKIKKPPRRPSAAMHARLKRRLAIAEAIIGALRQQLHCHVQKLNAARKQAFEDGRKSRRI